LTHITPPCRCSRGRRRCGRPVPGPGCGWLRCRQWRRCRAAGRGSLLGHQRARIETDPLQDPQAQGAAPLIAHYGLRTCWPHLWPHWPFEYIRIEPPTWSPLTESNRRPSPYHGDALPTELRGHTAGLRTSASLTGCGQAAWLGSYRTGTSARGEHTRPAGAVPNHKGPVRCLVSFPAGPGFSRPGVYEDVGATGARASKAAITSGHAGESGSMRSTWLAPGTSVAAVSSPTARPMAA
jgi:hypothetical protein